LTGFSSSGAVKVISMTPLWPGNLLVFDTHGDTTAGLVDTRTFSGTPWFSVIKRDTWSTVDNADVERLAVELGPR
jgi:hypothetical protein